MPNDVICNHFFSIVQRHCINFYSLQDKSKFNWLLSNTDDIIITELSNFNMNHLLNMDHIN